MNKHGDVLYLIDGRFSREDGPAKIFKSGRKEWYKRGILHRKRGDGPAIESEDGDKYWYVYNCLHRDGDLPAVEYSDGEKHWYRKGLRHRENGPAVESKYIKEYWINGEKIERGKNK